MKLSRDKKRQVVEELSSRLSASPNLYVTDFTGVAVKPMTELRRRLRGAGVAYAVVKKTLAVRAFESASVPGLGEFLEGPTGLVFAADRPVAAAKVLTEFQREYEALRIKAGLVEGKRVTPEEVGRLAMLPPREVMMGQLAGAMQAPLQGFVGALTGLMQQFVGALEVLSAQRGNV
ncbi:MAG: 50S ribosomal protein L10 [Gemmatimonadales bacterium]